MGSKAPTPQVVDPPPEYDPNQDAELLAMMSQIGGGGYTPPVPAMPETYKSEDIDWAQKREEFQQKLAGQTGDGPQIRTYSNSVLTGTAKPVDNDPMGLLVDDEEDKK